MPGTPRQVVGDEGHLRQILLNILANAVQFTHAGGITNEVDGEEVAGGLARLRMGGSLGVGSQVGAGSTF